MRSVIAVLCLAWIILPSQYVFARKIAPSALRAPDVTYEEVHLNNVSEFLQAPWSNLDQDDPTDGRGAYELKKPMEELDINAVSDIGSLEELSQEFEFIRDTKFIESQSLQFARRLSWLYPDDGCFVRAQLASKYAIANNYKRPSKMFAFGNLVVATANHPRGQVTWWYHVVLSYRVANDVYVIDPSIEPERALRLSEWREKMGGDGAQIQFAICDANAYQPYSNCAKPPENSQEDLKSTQVNFLGSEWERLTELGRDPNSELGDLPPWKKKSVLKNLLGR